MKQFLIYLSWYQCNKLAIIKADNKIKALEKLIVEQVKYNKLHDEFDLFYDLPYAPVYNYNLTERANIARYLNSIRNGEVSCDCYEINQDTDSIVQWSAKPGYFLEPCQK